MKKRLLALILAGVLLVGSAGAAFTATKTYAPGQFTDVAANAWYAASVKKVYELNLMNGSSATTFNPTGMFTVAEALTVAARMHHMDNGGNGLLPAAAGAWYQSAVNYCVQNKLITKDQFDSYTRSATRAEMAGVIRAALPDDRWKAINSVTALPDVNMGNDYAQAIFDLYNAGVFTGNDDYGMFQPYAYITRAEVAAIVARCADPAQRKTLNLKPLSQRQAPELMGGLISNVRLSVDRSFTAGMSNGRLPYKDQATQKYGYLDGNGNVVIPAQYDEVDNFSAGYAWVKKDGKWGMISTSGQITLALKYDGWEDYFLHWSSSASRFVEGAYVVHGPNGYGLVYNGKLVSADNYDSIVPCRTVDNLSSPSQRALVSKGYKYGVIGLDGKEIVPCQHSWLTRTNYSSSTYRYTCLTAAGPEGYVIAYDRGDVSEIVLHEGEQEHNCTATLYNSKGQIVAKKSFVGGTTWKKTEKINKIPTTWPGYAEPPMSTSSWSNKSTVHKFASGNPLFASCEGEKWAIGDSNGLFTEALYDDVTIPANADFAIVHYGNLKGLVGRSGEIFSPGTYDDFEAKGEYVIVKKDHKTVGVADVTGMLPGGEEDYFPKEDTTYVDKFSQNRYQVRTNDIGKPCLYYGNDKDGWTPVIEFYKNNMYYDEIKDIGEGYYACRFNTTWYLLHA